MLRGMTKPPMTLVEGAGTPPMTLVFRKRAPK